MAKKTLLIIVFVSFCVGTVALVVYGLAMHREPTFMQVCWTDNKVTSVEDSLEEENRGSCDSLEELVWPKSRLPLAITVEPYAGALAEFASTQVKKAVRLINSQLGYAHLRYRPAADPTGGKAADIRVVYGAPYETGTGTTRADRAAGSCSIERTDNGNDNASADEQRVRLHSLIRLRDVGDINLSYRILVHELGHCGLGLAHDPYESSIMYPFRAEDEGEHMSFIWFSDDDRKALRSRYAP